MALKSPLLLLNSLSFSFPNFQLENLNLSVLANECLCLLGPSGCGKSTILRLMAGLLQPSSGRSESFVAYDKLAVVFQEPRLIPWRNTLENVLLPFELMRPRGPRSEHIERSLNALKLVGLESAKNLFPHQLSGGMKMRASIARALVTEPKLILMDEPFAALDEMTRWQLQTDIRSLQLKLEMAIVFVTHSIEEATFLADRSVIMGRGGQIRYVQESPLPARRPSDLRFESIFHAELKKIHQLTRQDVAPS